MSDFRLTRLRLSAARSLAVIVVAVLAWTALLVGTGAIASVPFTPSGASAFAYDSWAGSRVDAPRAVGAGTSADGSSAPLIAAVGRLVPESARGSLQFHHTRFATEAAGELPGFSSSAAQLEAKFKHAADFGVLESRGASGFEAFGKAVDSFVGDSATVRVMGTYRGSPAILNYNPATAQVVVQATDGAFVSGWQMSPAQLQNVIAKASLGGG